MNETEFDSRTPYKKQTGKLEPPREESQDYSLDKNDFALEFNAGLFGEAESSASDSASKKRPAPWPDPGPQAIPVDLEAALFHFDGDRDFMLEMCKDFRDHLPQRVEQLRFALREENIGLLTNKAHALKGISLYFKADYLAILAARLEECSKSEIFSEISGLVEKIEKEAMRVVKYLSSNESEG